MTQAKFYITTAISYPNGAPHIGHAYEAVATDAIARFKRIDGYRVFFLTGVDEHGMKMTQTAAKEGLTPRELSDRNTADLRGHVRPLVDLARPLHPHDRARPLRSLPGALASHAGGRRHLPRHIRRLVFGARRSLLRRERDQARRKRRTLRAARDAGQWTEEQTYFFRLSAYQDRLLRLYEANPGFIGPETRRNEVVSFVKGGLQDLSISRSTLSWGVPVPDAPGHVMYVWVDALTNYITALGFPDENAPLWRYWPADYHIIGKDIVRFHAVYWPAFLMSAGVAVPKRVFGHGFLFNRGEKMSKSIGNVIDPFALADAYGVDQLRYFFLREVAFGQDGSYSHEAIVNRINADLANDLGNLAQRSLSMIARNCEGLVPTPSRFSEADAALLAQADGLPARVRAAMDQLAPHVALAEIWSIVAAANRYFASEEPWVKRKSAPERFATVLYVDARDVASGGHRHAAFHPGRGGQAARPPRRRARTGAN